MGGEGSMLHAIKSLQRNRALLKERNFKKIRDSYIDNSQKTELKFKEVSPKELFRIKQQIKRQSKRNRQIELGIYIASAALTIAFFFILFWFTTS